MKNYENIPSNSLKVIDFSEKSENVNVRFFSNGTIELSHFAVMQLLQGAITVVAGNDPYNVFGRRESNLYFYLTKLLLTPAAKLFVERLDLRVFKVWLEARMEHCEKERDAQNPKFNPDTYIGQKLLLLDLRELLVGNID